MNNFKVKILPVVQLYNLLIKYMNNFFFDFIEKKKVIIDS